MPLNEIRPRNSTKSKGTAQDESTWEREEEKVET